MKTILTLIIGLVLTKVYRAQDTSDDLVLKVKKGVSVTFPCSVPSFDDNEQLVAVTWKVEDRMIAGCSSSKEIFFQNDYGYRAAMDNSTFALILFDISMDDAGTYVCNVITSSNSYEEPVVLEVYISPEVSVTTTSIALSIDEPIRSYDVATCSAIGGSLPLYIKWVDAVTGDVIIDDSQRTSSTNVDNANLTDVFLSLNVELNPLRDYEKVFTCYVDDAGSQTQSSDAKVSFTIKPMITTFPRSSVSMRLGKSRTFDCGASGFPIPSVTWYQGSTKVAEGRNRASLEISPVSIHESPLFYICKAENSEGEDERKFLVDVQAPPVILSKYNESETLTIDLDSDTIVLSCQAIANPVAVFTWNILGENSTDSIEEANVTISDKIVYSTVEINSQIFASKKKAVICTATNKISSDTYQYNILPPDPKAAAAGWVFGVVIAVIILVVLLFLIIYFAMSSQRKKAELNSEEEAERGCLDCVCLPCCKSDKSTTIESVEGQENEQIKEVSESGTKEEKQKLTEAEEKPSEKEKEGASSESENTTENVSDKKVSKLKVGFPTSCCKGSKKQLKEEDSVNDEGKVEAEQKDNPTNDGDSGKGDTLDKMIDEPEK